MTTDDDHADPVDGWPRPEDRAGEAPTMRLPRTVATRRPAQGPARPTRPPRTVAPILAGVGFVVVLLALGALARTSSITADQLHFDQQVADSRVSVLTALATVLTYAATPEVVGVAAAIVVPVVLALLGRRADAVRWLCVVGGSLALALVVKKIVAEARPPAALWAIPADGGFSYPSGHTTVACSITVALVLLAHGSTGRALAITGAVFALAVAFSRVYVANHYPLDVLGGGLAAVATGLVVMGLAAVPAVDRRLCRLDSARVRDRAEPGADPPRRPPAPPRGDQPDGRWAGSDWDVPEGSRDRPDRDVWHDG